MVTNTMIQKTITLIMASLTLSGVAPAVVVFQDDFSTNTLGANYVTTGVSYNSTPETVTISRGPGNNLQIANPLTLDSYGATELTISFDYAFGASMFGSEFTLQYNDGAGTGWQTLDVINRTATGENDSGLATNPYTITIDEGATYAFTNTALVRLIDIDNTGSKGYNIDNFTLEVDAVPEPAAAMLGAIGGLLLLRRRRT